MANKHLTDGLESNIERYNHTIIYDNKQCRICGGNEFVVYDGIYVCCKRCGVIAACLSFQTCDINKANPIGFNKIHKKKINAKAKNKQRLKIKKKKMMKHAKREIKKKDER